VALRISSDPIVLDLESMMSVSLIVAELVTNSLKHAFGGRVEGSISIDISTSGAQATLRYGDDGPGLSPDFGKSDRDSLGQGILQSLARQLHGTLTYERGAGAVTKLVFPAPASTRRGRAGRIGRLSV
jgi:two-component sensor histidine kinase